VAQGRAAPRRPPTVVCPDLRGYGESSKVAPYTKRAMAGDVLALMRTHGHEQFAVVGHDRGAYVASRLALDHPDRVTHAVVMDAVPIGEALARVDARAASSWWHWFFFGQTDKPAERVINTDPDAWYRVGGALMGEEAYADFRRALHDPEVVHAMVEDYRAGLRDDHDADDPDRIAGRTVRCRLLVVWATRDDLEELHGDPLSVWRAWSDDLSGVALDAGHHMAEEVPRELAAGLPAFLAR
jgi:haloacetate dehalogenase